MASTLSYRQKRLTHQRLSRHRHWLHSPWSGGVLLMLFAALALGLANNPWTATAYHHLLESPLTLGFEHFRLQQPLEAWVNDGLMVLFFFYVGLEIKREFMVGHLSGVRHAALPIAAALGGMIVPALCYTALNLHDGIPQGWGIAMATDIAFAVGILSLLGKRVPVALKVFLTALAVVDDLGGITVIALFYSSDLNLGVLYLASGVFLLLLLLKRMQVYRMRYYLLLSILLWILFLFSGIHATISGVLIALAIPTTPRYTKAYYLRKTEYLLHNFVRHDRPGVELLANPRQHHDIERLRQIATHTLSPAQRLEYALQPVVALFVMPIFALANAGVSIQGFEDLQGVVQPVGLGIIVGLVIGKPMGIFLFSRIAVATGYCELPRGTSWFMLWGVACLSGIGFTMAIFINNLALPNPQIITQGKIAILIASFIAMIVGYGLLRIALIRKKPSKK
ncbi:MAG: Na+/H+ antiporter NhaA [Alistipes sp.]|nr:Na+/H+ antiporter NhaA [Alistipes sp.]